MELPEDTTPPARHLHPGRRFLPHASLLILLGTVAACWFFLRLLSNQNTQGPDGRYFVIGGMDPDHSYAEVYSARLSDLRSGGAGCWIPASPLPMKLQGHAAVSAKGFAIVVGGKREDGTLSAAVFVAPLLEDGLGSWAQTEALPRPLAYHAMAQDSDWIWVSGGQAPEDSDLVYAARIQEGGKISSWIDAGLLPKPMRGHALVAANHGLFLLGGHDQKEYFGDVYFASCLPDGKLGPWAQTSALPLPLVHAGALVVRDQLFLLGGQDANGWLSAEVYVGRIAAGRIGSWSKLRDLPVPLARFSLSLDGNRLLIAGGGYGFSQPVHAAILEAEVFADGTISPFRALANLPRPLAFHGALLWPR